MEILCCWPINYLNFLLINELFSINIKIAIPDISTKFSLSPERSDSVVNENILFSDEFEITFEGRSLGLLLVGLYNINCALVSRYPKQLDT